MTAGAFDRLLYTDCRAGTGRGAGGGFQVQAQSAGVDAAQAKMAVGWLLYDVPNAWIMQRRAVEEFPLGFAHAAEAGYGTAQSRYVGTEATGARQGNHLADCLLTRDLDLYGPTRPAQLWRSQLWRAEAWDTTDCPQFAETLALGPLTVDAIAGWLRDRPERAGVLARLLSVLEDPAGRGVVIAAAGPDEALWWIAAATLLLPARAALAVSFKVFCSNPQRASHRIVAVPKELNPQVLPGRRGSAFVLDAEEAISDEAAVSERARFWAERFATADDPYDVIDAVELAELLDPGAERGGMDALITAWAVTVPDSPLDDPQALFRWLSGADPKLQQEQGPPVAGRILAADPPLATLRWIDAAAARGGIDVDRAAARGLLLTAEIAEVRSGVAPPGEILIRVDVGASARRDADSELSSAIVLGSDQQVDLLLCLSMRHGIVPEVQPLRDRLHSFATGWIDHPARDYSPGRWALREEIVDLAYDELQARFAANGVHGVADPLRRLAPYFADRPYDLLDPLACHVQAAAIRTQPGEQRLARMSALLDEACCHPRAEEAVANLQQALIAWRALGPAEALALVTALPDSVPIAPEAADLAAAEIQRTAARPTAQTLDALGVLGRRGMVPPEQPFSGLLAADDDVVGFVHAVRSTRFRDDAGWARRCLEYLGRTDPAVAGARLALLLRACLEYPAPDLGADVLCVLPAPLPGLLIDRWARQLHGAHAMRTAVWGVCWAGDPRLDKLRPHIASAFRDFGAVLGPGSRERWFLDVQQQLGPDYARIWAELSGDEAAKRHRGRRLRGKETR